MYLVGYEEEDQEKPRNETHSMHEVQDYCIVLFSRASLVRYLLVYVLRGTSVPRLVV